MKTSPEESARLSQVASEAMRDAHITEALLNEMETSHRVMWETYPDNIVTNAMNEYAKKSSPDKPSAGITRAERVLDWAWEAPPREAREERYLQIATTLQTILNDTESASWPYRQLFLGRATRAVSAALGGVAPLTAIAKGEVTLTELTRNQMALAADMIALNATDNERAGLMNALAEALKSAPDGFFTQKSN